MADYYPLLVRAISGLSQNTGESRKSVYDRARGALLKQLRSVEPPLPEGEILRERQALEEAIRRVEADQVPDPAPAETEDEPAAAEAPPSPPAAPLPTSAPLPEMPRAPAGRPDPLVAAKAIADKALADKPAADTAPADKTVAASPAVETPAAASETAGDDDVPLDESTITRPTLARGRVAEKQDRHERPRLPAEKDAGGKPRWQRTVLMVGLIGILIAGGAYAVVNRETLFGATERPVAAAPAAPAPEAARQDQPKSADRVTQSGAAPAQRPNAPAPRQGMTAQRAYLFEEAAGGSQGLQTYEGTVTWKTETFNAGPGLPPDVGIRADVQIPGRLGTTFTLRRNADAALPASHTIELSFTLPPDFAYGGISNVPGIRMKQTESAQGAPLAGLSVRVNPTYFLVGLSAVPVDKDRNLQLLQSRPWIDIPIVYTNNKRAILAFEKGPAGDQAFQDAFTAWGEFIPQVPPPMSPVPAPSAN
ncbi:hypothetical protein [Aquabacter cavernae]|uniref:hypothetical protein n=1 Tax=Aquabacter cavernae TaxID=2496029 RepID=UPI000F8E5C7F|nr:hypothetical protein [Aquabacter cavernae]